MNAAVQMDFDWKNPDYTSVLRLRMARLQWLRRNPAKLEALKTYYREHVADFVNDWGMTFDPRNAERDLPTVLPFILWPKQREFLAYIDAQWRGREPGLVEKTRDSGASWLCIAWACTRCLFSRQTLSIGFGSRKAEYVDEIGQPKSLLEKARIFLRALPSEFLEGWTIDCARQMRIMFPGSGSVISGECGDGIGRGDRTTIYFVDESAFLERPDLSEHSLSRTTNCRIDVSTPNGRTNPFALKRFAGKIKVFSFHWFDDPRLDEEWLRKQEDLLDPVTFNQEILCNYDASVARQLIPAAWVQAAIGAHTKLGIEPTGAKRGALDVADEGTDRNCFAGRHGVVLNFLESWSGKDSDILKTVERTMGLCHSHGYQAFNYDADGMGAGVRGDARSVNEQRKIEGLPLIRDYPFQGSGAVSEPDAEFKMGLDSKSPTTKRLNKDYFLNLKAQSWWSLRVRFQQTHRAVVEGKTVDPDSIISIDPKLPELNELLAELTQPTWSVNGVGKLVIDKKPDGALSPNRADAVMIAFNPQKQALEAWLRLGK